MPLTPSATDLFTKVGNPGSATTLSAPGYTIGDTEITVGSTSEWPDDTRVFFAIDRAEVVSGETVRVAGTYNEFSGIVTGAGIITSVVQQKGTPQDYPAASLTRVYIPVSSSREDALVDGLAVSHNLDGTIKSGAIGLAAMLGSGVVTTAKILDAAVTTAKLADAAVTPVKWTNPYKFSVYLSADQTGVVDATFTKVAFNTERFDSNGNFASNKYTAPADGFYQIDGYLSLAFSGGAVGVAGIISLYKNGVELLRGDMGTPSNSNNASLLTGNIGNLVQLTTGDTLEIYAYADVTSGTGRVVGSATGSRFSGFLVSQT